MKKDHHIKVFFSRFLSYALSLGVLMGLFSFSAAAKEESDAVAGTVYEFDKDAHYEVSDKQVIDMQPFGTFRASGNIRTNGNSITVLNGPLSFSYTFSPSRLNVEDTEWHIVEDKSKKVDSVDLGQNILNGAVLVQSSRDGNTWLTDAVFTNVFTEDSPLKDSIYQTKEVQLINGCHYRVIVVYKLQRKTGGKNFWVFDAMEEKKIAEVYEFYAVSSETSKGPSSAATAPRTEIGIKHKTDTDAGYSGQQDIDEKDPHFGWTLGTFAVNGYTGKVGSNDNPVFLKNVGDKVTLWFTLNQDINCLNNDGRLTIADDSNGSDREFEVRATNFKHGALIIRFTDHEGKTHDPIIYTDFLAANAATTADTRVQLFEEGDYEVSLDYEIKKDSNLVGPIPGIPTYTNYKIAFRFKIRNGNCMVFPFDASTGDELTDRTITPNGFKLDMAKSRYLTIDVARAALVMSDSGSLVEDIRFNRPAKDNEVYTDDGIYTFTVTNPSTEETTIKTIYVGTDKYLLALSKNNLTVEKLNEKLAEGAIVNEDGTITGFTPEPTPDSAVEPTPTPEPTPAPTPEPTPVNTPRPTPPHGIDTTVTIQSSMSTASVAILVTVILAVAAGCFMIWYKRKR